MPTNGVSKVPTGRVKFYKEDVGYGFIVPDDGRRDLFVHVTAIQAARLKSLRDNQRLSFDIVPDPRGKGPLATNLVDLDVQSEIIP
jgi:CspA family cold shock protein